MTSPPPWANPWYQYYQPSPNLYAPPGYRGPGYVDPRLYGPIEPQRTWKIWSKHFARSFRNQSSGYLSEKYPKLNPILAEDTTLLRFDVKKKPRTEILASTYYSTCHVPATSNGVTHLRLISKAFPWTIDIISPAPVTCEAVWDALYAALQEHIADSEWGLILAMKKQKEVVEKAAKKRFETEPRTNDKQLKRIDYLGEATLFKGLCKDEDYEKQRLLPSDKGCPDTWLVKFGS